MKKVRHQTQIGPTCGFYAIVMIINTLCEKCNVEPINKNGSDTLVSSLLNLAIAKGCSNIGELLTIGDITKILDIYNEEHSTHKLNYTVVEFHSINDFRGELDSAFRESKYILFPYYANGGKVKSKKSPTNNDMRHTHWGILYQDDNKELICQQGNSSGQQSTTFEKLYDSNNTLSKDFMWDKYFSFYNFLNSRCNVIRAKDPEYVKNIKTKIKRSKEKKLQLQGKSIKMDLRGKMIFIAEFN